MICYLGFLFLFSPLSHLAAQEPADLKADASRDLFDLATLYYSEGVRDPASYRLAARTFERLLQRFPRHPRGVEARYFLALSYQNSGATGKAHQRFRETAAIAPSGKFLTGALLQLASSAFEAQDWTRAARLFQRLSQDAEDEKIQQESLYRLFLSHHHLNDEKKAIDALEAYLATAATTYRETAQRSLAQLYQKSGRLAEAFTLYAELARSKDQTTSAEATLQAALITRETGEKKLALSWFSAAYRHPGLEKWRGQSQLTLMDLAAEREDWPTVLRLFQGQRHLLPAKAATHRLQLAAKAFEKTGKPQDALALYQELERADPKNSSARDTAYRLAVQSYQRNSRSFPKLARDFLHRYPPPQHPVQGHPILFLAAETAYRRKDYTAAAHHFNNLDLDHLDPANHRSALLHHAVALLELAQEEPALAAIAHYLEAFPKSKQAPDLRLRRAELLTSLGRTVEAKPDYLVLTQSPEPKVKVLALQRLAVLYREEKDYQNFADIQRRLLTLPDLSKQQEASSHFWLGWESYRVQNFPNARRHLGKARDLSPRLFTGKVAPMLTRIAYQEEDLDALEQELALWQKSPERASIPADIRTWLAATLASQEQYTRAWNIFKNTGWESAKPQIQRLYLRTALGTSHFTEVLAASKILLPQEGNPYRKAELHHARARAFLHLKRFDDARDSITEALKLRPTGRLDYDLRLLAGEVEMAAAQPEAALRHFLLVDSLYAKSPEEKATARRKLRLCLELIGTPEALAQLKKYP